MSLGFASVLAGDSTRLDSNEVTGIEANFSHFILKLENSATTQIDYLPEKSEYTLKYTLEKHSSS